MKTTFDEIFAAYLVDVESAASHLPEYVRREIATSLKSHIEEAVAERGISTERDARQLLAELGDPVSIIAEAEAAEMAHTGRQESDIRATLGWLTLGSLIPVGGWLYGVLRLWRSSNWSTRDKIIGTALIPGGLFGALISIIIVGANSGEVCTRSEFVETSGLGGTPVADPVTGYSCQTVGIFAPWLAWVLALLIVLATLAGPVWLSRRAAKGSRSY